MSIEIINCTNCGIETPKSRGELNRQRRKGKRNFFCTQSCASVYSNRKFKIDVQIQEKKCLHCGTLFSTYFATFCSRSCASAGSITEERIEGNRKGGLNSPTHFDSKKIAATLKTRENWKYTELSNYLSRLSLSFEFEFQLGGSIFDLCVKNFGVLFEFDGGYHANSVDQQFKDFEKNLIARENSYILFRIDVEDNSVIPVSEIETIIVSFLS